jgi:hypothetical protein
MAAMARGATAGSRPIGVLGISLVCVLLTLFFLFLSFPYDRLGERLAAELNRDDGTQLSFQELGPYISLAGPGFELTGHEPIRAGMRSIERYSATFHAVHNQLVEIYGDDAHGDTWCVASHLHEVEGRPYKLDWGIRYKDRYRREEGRWRIARRGLELVWEQDLPLTDPT